ncbi:MAG: transcriptional regulator [Burkholderiales bacterium]|nr:MAG: transcriptional regulator [Burkholderiales bacterium]TAG79523.1 MAG: transcriptional regulator [Betaproteobacteria bacterium]
MKTIDAAPILASLAQPTRLDIFRALVVAGPAGLPAGALADALGVAPAALSFHLKELRFAQLVDSEQQGRYVIYRARFDTMNALLSFLTENCCAAASESSVNAACCPPAAQKKSRRAS